MKAPYYPPNSPLNALKTVIQSMSMLLTLDFSLRTSASSLPTKISFCNTFKSKSLRNNKKRQINQNFGTIFHTEDCLNSSRLQMAEIVTNFGGHNLKIRHRMSFDHNCLKNCHAKHFQNSLELMQKVFF